MGKLNDDELDLIFGALSDRTRRSILQRLAKEEIAVSDLAEPYAMSLTAITKHLNVLENAGLIERQKSGRVRRCTLNAVPLEEASEWIETYKQFWEKQLDALDEFLKNKS